ncbi:MAG: hypothetical protein M1815_003345 [Lichina confinis]|nr:MAG: hypothetical protein M1815_003345 [Lichina confinis]
MAAIDEPATSVHRPPVVLPTTQASSSQIYVGAAAEPAIRSKRSRSPTVQRRSPELAQHPAMSLATTRASPGPLSPKPVTARFSPRPLTAAEALAAERRSRASVASNRSDNNDDGRGQSSNPAVNAIEALLGSAPNVSRPDDAPRETTSMSEGVTIAAQAMSLPDQAPAAQAPITTTAAAATAAAATAATEPAVSHPSPVSTSSLASAMGSVPTVTAEALRTPTKAVETSRDARHQAAHGFGRSTGSLNGFDEQQQQQQQQQRHVNRAFTFPGRILGADAEDPLTPARGMTLPAPEPSSQVQRTSSSSSVKKHRCTHCSTEFTRHHNLKSHLLTHSHEKPYVCETCQARFRRLHDLKRHTKLHTGERPHICPRCNRRFARGDALARHNKGQSGCAGRRSSAGSLGGDDDDEAMQDADLTGGDDQMEDLVYTSEEQQQQQHHHHHHHHHHAEGSSRTDQGSPTIAPGSHHGISGAATAESIRALPGVGGHGGFALPSQASTYPPPGQRRDLGPSGGSGGGSGGSGGSRSQSRLPESKSTATSRFQGALPIASASASVTRAGGGSGSGSGSMSAFLHHGGMTESPAPLSPGNAVTATLRRADTVGTSRRPRSPSLTQQLQQRNWGRRSNSHSSPQQGLPPPLPSFAGVAGVGGPPRGPGSDVPPSLSSSFTQPPPPPPQLSPGPAMSSPLSRSTGLPGESSSMGDGSRAVGATGGSGGTASGPTQDDMWRYIRSLESRLNQLSDEVTGLRRALSTQNRRGDSLRGSSSFSSGGGGVSGGSGGGSNNNSMSQSRNGL